MTTTPWKVEPHKHSDALADLVNESGTVLVTGFVETIDQIVREHNAQGVMVGALELFKRAFPYEKEFIEGSVQHKAIVAREAALRQAGR